MNTRAISLAAFVWLGLAAASALAADGIHSHKDRAAYKDYFHATYDVIGRLPDSGKMYAGKVALVAKGNGFKVTRTIDGETTEGAAFVDTHWHVLVMRFKQGGRRYEGTYQFETNYDSYPRLTGHVAKPGHSREDPPGYGVEALFPGDDPACADGI